MTLTALGRVNVTVPGTPVPLSTNPQLRVAKIFFQAIPGGAGKCYIGTPQMNKTALTQVLRILIPASASAVADQFGIEPKDGLDGVYLNQYAIDADIAGDGLLVSYWTE